MNLENFNLAMSIIVKSHTSKIHINVVKPNGSVSVVLESPTIHIESCVPKVVQSLIQEGFTLSMKNGLMAVERYS